MDLIAPLNLKGILIVWVCGAVMGLERQIRGKPAGIRTSVLICFGTYVFIRLATSLHAGSFDALRVIGPVTTGIGFLGAGVMFSREGLVAGVTTASVIWVLAGVGAAAGLGRYPAAVMVTLVALATLVGIEALESASEKLRRGVHAREEECTPANGRPERG